MFHKKKITKISSFILASSLLLVGCQSNDQATDQDKPGIIMHADANGIELEMIEESFVGTVVEKIANENGSFDIIVTGYPYYTSPETIRVTKTEFNSFEVGEKGNLVMRIFHFRNGKFHSRKTYFEKNNNPEELKELDEQEMTTEHLKRVKANYEAYLGRAFVESKEKKVEIKDNQLLVTLDNTQSRVLTFSAYGLEKWEAIYDSVVSDKIDNESLDEIIVNVKKPDISEYLYVPTEDFNGMKVGDKGQLIITEEYQSQIRDKDITGENITRYNEFVKNN